ncbi:MAG: HNH endonuclease [Candidatus Saccharimonadales bacterium]
MSYPFGVRQESHPTFLHPEGLPVVGEDYIAPVGLHLPSTQTSTFELDALFAFVEANEATPNQPLPTLRQLGKVSINSASGCWEVPVYKDGVDTYPDDSKRAGAKRARYGRMAIKYIDSTHALAHRMLFVVMRGPIEDGLYLDHLCENKACTWHRHLDPVTPAENTKRIHEAAQLKSGQGLLDL